MNYHFEKMRADGLERRLTYLMGKLRELESSMKKDVEHNNESGDYGAAYNADFYRKQVTALLEEMTDEQ